MSDSKKLIIKILIFSFVFNGMDVIIQWLAVSPWGKGQLLFIPIIIIIPLVISFILIPASLIAAIYKPIRKKSLIWLYSSLLYLFVGILLFKLGGFVRMQAFERLAERSAPLVEAIHHYNKDNRQPPQKLADLAPKYITEIPKTGIGAYPEYRYELVKDPKMWDENPWVLYVDTPLGGLNWDMFLYFPKQNYPQRGYGGFLEKIRDWAYVHE